MLTAVERERIYRTSVEQLGVERLEAKALAMPSDFSDELLPPVITLTLDEYTKRYGGERRYAGQK